jgi:photosystem II stability/assembly factor-like uncharacterized protein
MVTPNTLVNGIYTGDCYVFDSSGGFTIQSNLPLISLSPTLPLAQYDVTNAIQIKFSVRKFNDQLGIIKDENNDKTLEILNFDISNQIFSTDDVTIYSDEFLQSINTESILSMGNLSTLYSDFNYTVMQYFNDPTGLFSLFSYNNILQLTNGSFDSKSFINLLNGITFDIEGCFVTDLSGYFTVNNVNDHIRYCCDTNIFNNRKDETNYIFNILDGFREGDLIFIPNGMNITLSVHIESKLYNDNNTELPIPNNLSSDPSLNYTNSKTNVSKTTTYNSTGITQTFTVPILLVLTNQDTFNIANFCQNWIDVSTKYIGTRKWIAVSISSIGQFQCSVNSYGDIYISNHYGNMNTWHLVYNIGIAQEFVVNTSLSNCIAVSENGQHITASNGSEIFVSNNYGEPGSWVMIKKFVTPNNIYVAISLNGQYQSVLSSGDTSYSSSDYGQTWSGITDIQNAIFNSLNIFQFAGVCMSFNGMYQTIACERIYISSSYGRNWTEIYYVTNDLTDLQNIEHNWTGVSMSSEGKYQTAIDSGGYIYRSTDYGNNWTYINNGIGQDLWTGVSISASGKFQTALTGNNGCIYFSTDYGVSWNKTTSTVVQNRSFQALSISANGQYQTAVEYGGAIYTSNLV